MKVVVNYKMGVSKSISASLKKEVDEIAEPEVKRIILNVADDAIDMSPVDTGAFVTSWSIVSSGSGSGRSRTSNNKPRLQSPEQKKEEAKSGIRSDLASLDVIEKNVVLRNRAPHSPSVQNKYAILAKLRDRYR